MNKIESFLVNHLNLKSGLYVSRKDSCNNVTVTTFDLRFTMPNKEPVMTSPAIHTLEHLGATYLRNSSEKEKIVYFGPMGCKTGFYLILFGDLSSYDVYPLVVKMLEFIVNFEGEIPGATPIECGNYSEQDLPTAKAYAKEYLHRLTTLKNLKYEEWFIMNHSFKLK